MEYSKHCPQCGKQLSPDAPAGLCPECLLKQGFNSEIDSQPMEKTAAMTGFLPPEPEELAKRFPQLEILELIGKGGMGAVYKARQPNLDRLVALKILPPEVGEDPAFAERFTREARALARLNHPHVVAVYDFGEADGLFYFLMEYVDGTNIRRLIQSGGINPQEALAIVPQICEALQFAHDEGIVHRDIKPENILVDKKGRVKIADFGLAKILGGTDGSPVEKPFTLTGTHQVMGTVHYMAPEQIEHPLEVDHRADIYSLGVVFYEMLTGELPIGRFAPPSEKVQIDVRLDEVVLRSLEKEPEKRYQHVSEVKSEVESICGLPNLAVQRMFGYEYRSGTTLFGWPLVHIAYGIDPATGRKRIAKGVIAIGDVAIGGLAIGGFAMGGVVFGGVGIGLLTLAGAALGLLAAVGGLAIGGFAFGGLAVGGIAIGGGAVGIFAYGGSAWGLHAMSGSVKDPQAVEFFDSWANLWTKWLAAGAMIIPAAIGLMWLVIWVVFRLKFDKGNSVGERKTTATTELSADATRQSPTIEQQVRGPAMGIVATGVLIWTLIAIFVVYLSITEGPPHPALYGKIFNVMSLVVASATFLIFAGIRMMNLQSYRLSIVASVVAIVVSPSNLIGLPIGIWALVVLTQKEVKNAFAREKSDENPLT